MNLANIWSIITKVIDICFVWIAFYYILKNVKNNTKMALIVKGVIIILIVKFISDLLNLYTVGVILEYAIEWGPLAIIVVFQPEIRAVLESIGRTQLLGRHRVLSISEREKLHDGGVIIQGDKITCAGSVFKTSMNQAISKKLGTRHRAALGIAEESDAIALVASEETGRLSIAMDSELHYNLTLEEFRSILLDELSNKTEIFFDADDSEELEDQDA